MARVIVTGLIAQHRSMGGVAWDYLNVVLGLEQLGHDVYYLEDSGEWPYVDDGPEGEPWIAHDPAAHVGYLAQTLDRFGLGERWAYRYPIRDEWYGMGAKQRGDVFASADILLNVSGTLDYPDRYRNVPTLAYVDTDPVFTQISAAVGGESLTRRGCLGMSVCEPGETPDETFLDGWTRDEKLRRRIDLHDVFFTVGERIDRLFPDTSHAWIPTKHPIALSEWRTTQPLREAYTTVANWTSYPPVAFAGRSYGQKDIELMRLMRLPAAAAPVQLELAMPEIHHTAWESRPEYGVRSGVDPVDVFEGDTPQDVLRRHGWNVVSAALVAGGLGCYRAYLQSSKGEFSVAKHAYVAGCSGWFSGRSACYLAAGRPVVVQDTGFDGLVPTGEGIVGFTTLEEAVEGLRAVEADYSRHARAAADIAAEYFDSGKVLRRILNAC